MQAIPDLVHAAVEEGGHDLEDIAHRLEVSVTTVRRWLDGRSRPRPALEGRLRALCEHAVTGPGEPQLDLAFPRTAEAPNLRDAIRSALGMLREALHRRGRFSSSNQTLDEIAKLLFAHLMPIVHGEQGITRESVLSGSGTEYAARDLGEFVKAAYSRYLPQTADIDPKDFMLALKPGENALAMDMIDSFASLPLDALPQNRSAILDIDIFNEIFGSFLAGQFHDEKELGQYLTPPEVVSFMIEMAYADMNRAEREVFRQSGSDSGLIVDPSCGVGSFLVAFVRRALRDVPIKDRRRAREMLLSKCVGIDKSERMIRLAVTNLATLGDVPTHLHCANGLAREGTEAQLTDGLEGRVSLILTNPPFGAEFGPHDTTRFRLSATNPTRRRTIDSELLFLERYVDWLKPGGMCLAIVPDSILTNKGTYADLRSMLGSSLDIRSVVSLPPTTFAAAGTMTKTSVLHFRKQTKSQNNRSFFAICQDIGYTVSNRGNHRTKIPSGGNDLPLILDVFRGSRPQNGHGRWLPDATDHRRWDALYHASLPAEIEDRLANPRADDLRLRDVATFSSERTDPRRFGKDCFEYIEISDVSPSETFVRSKTLCTKDAPSRARKLVKSGDILLSTVRPERRTIGVVPPHLDGAICTTGFSVIRPTIVHPLALALALQSDFVTKQIMRNNIGIAYPAIDEECLPGLLLPLSEPGFTEVAEAATRVVLAEDELRSALNQLSQLSDNKVSEWISPR